jgi:hypothetical protein
MQVGIFSRRVRHDARMAAAVSLWEKGVVGQPPFFRKQEGEVLSLHCTVLRRSHIYSTSNWLCFAWLSVVARPTRMFL